MRAGDVPGERFTERADSLSRRRDRGWSPEDAEATYGLEPLNDGYPDDDQHRSQEARDDRGVDGDAEQAEVVYGDRGDDLPRQEHADRGRRAEEGSEEVVTRKASSLGR
jgi:hypothetical protein